jgi:hypothetical protein
MKTIKATFLLLTAMVTAVLLFAPLPARADDDDPPGRVARLNYTHGSVSFEPAGADEWVGAVVNRPITTGDKLWTDKDSRAELHIGTAAIRLHQETGFSFLELSDQVTQIRLTEGTINVHLRRLDSDETFEVDTPNLAFSLLQPGDYRIDVNDAGDVTNIAVRDGQGEVTGGGQSFEIGAGQGGAFSGTDQLTSDIEGVPSDDDFDRWCADRDQHEDRAQSAPYVSRDVIGYEDLDDYGDWRDEGEYGHVWVPRGVVAGWAPYRYGHWIWVSPWGWTWVDDSPWGFAPFHYGRWVFVRGYWGWVPGPVAMRPVYAPALVAWVGGPHFSLSFAVGGVGAGVAWFPLGPREVYVPPYRVSRTYVNRVNITDTTVNNIYVTNVYNNYQSNRVTNVRYVNRTAVTATSQNAFTSAQPVGRNMMHVDQRQIANAPVGTVAVAPGNRSILGAGVTGPHVAQPPAMVQQRTVVARRQPPPPPAPFAAQEKAIQANGGRPVPSSQLNQLRPAGGQNAGTVQQRVRIAPPVQAGVHQQGNRPVQVSKPVNEAPAQNAKPVQTNRPVYQPPAQNGRIREDRPPSAQPVPRVDTNAPTNANPQTNRADRPPSSPQPNPQQLKYQQQQEQLRQKQTQEQQRLQQKQEADRQRVLQRQTDQRQQEKLQQQQQQQQQKLRQRQQVQQQKLKQKQQKQQEKDERQNNRK